MKYLIAQHNCNSQCCDINGLTPLHLACCNGHLHVAKYLIQDQNCSCEVKCSVEVIHNVGPTSCLKCYYTGLTAVDFACLNGHQDVVSYLRNEQHCSSGFDQAFKSAMSQLSSYVFGLRDCLASISLTTMLAFLNYKWPVLMETLQQLKCV